MKYNLVVGCIFLLIFNSRAQNSVDKLERAINERAYDKAAVMAQRLKLSEVPIERSYAHWALGIYNLYIDLDSAKYHFDKALDERPDRSLRIRILNSTATYYDIIGFSRESIKLLLQAVKLSISGDGQDLPRIYNNLCAAYRSQGLYDSSIYYGLEGLKLSENTDQLRLTGILYNSVASTFAVQGDYSEAEEYYQKSLALAIQNSDTASIYVKYVNLALLNINQENTEQAINYLELAKPLMDEDNILNFYEIYGRLGLLYSKDPDSRVLALENYQVALNYIRNSKLYNEQMLLYMNLADLLKKTDLQRSRLFLDSAEAYLEVTDDYENYLPYSVVERDILIESKAYESALQVQKRIDSLELLQYDLEKTKVVEELQTRFETDKKEQEIASLKQQATISQLRLKQQRLLTFSSLILLGLMSSVGIALYRNRRLRLIQQKLMVEQRLLRTQMNPHFLFNALSSVHSYIYEGDKRKAAEYLSMFSDLSRDVLNQSTEELILLEKELETLEKYVELQKTRYPWLVYEVDTGELEKDITLVPPMLLQPFVENSIEHGFKGKNEGHIKLIICGEGEMLTIRLVDDGTGLVEPLASRHKSKAIEIAEERLSLLLKKGQKHVLSVQNRKDGKGVEVTIKFPIITSV